MSSFEQLDPRLRETASNAFSQPPSYPAQFPPAATPSSRSPVGHPLHQQQFESHHSPVGNSYPSHSPQSAGNGTDRGSNFGGPSDAPRRPRACEACRGLKVKCDPDPNNQDGPCKRCAKANRVCTVTVPSRKRQKKTDSKVAELEKKIEALSHTLAQQQKSGATALAEGSLEPQGMNVHQGQHNAYQQVTNGNFGAPYATSPYSGRSDIRPEEWTGYKGPEYEPSKNAGPPMVVAGQKRKHSDIHNSSISTDSSVLRTNSEAHNGFLVDGGKSVRHNEYADVIDRGFLTAEMASKLFECYITKMVQHMPAVVFPVGTTAADVRKTTPTLFLAILSAASGSSYPELQRPLTKELMITYSRIISLGEKNLELIQALIVSTLWYYPPEHFEELKFYQLIHIAAVMGIDIGINKKIKAQKVKPVGLWRDNPWRRTPYPDPESLEARRAWLACYFLCCNASMGLRRPNLITWTSYMGECMEALESSSEAAPTDKILCHWIRSQHIAEEVGARFSMDDPIATISITDANVQRSMRGFELDLDRWIKSVPANESTPTLVVTGHVVNLYIHEIALHANHNIEEFKPPFTEEHLRMDKDQFKPLSNPQVEALSACVDAIDGIFVTFLKFDVEAIRCLPVANFVRVAYAVVILIKMYFAATQPHSELGKVIKKDDIKVEQYLDGLVAIFRASAAEEKSRPSGKFLMVLLMLKTWFHRQRQGGQPLPANESAPKAENKSESSSESETAPNTHGRNGQQASYSPANTPLQLLSEVATGNSGQAHPESMANYPGGNNDWQQPNYAQNYPSTRTYGPNQKYGSVQGLEVPGLDYGYTVGDGFEQAMGMPPEFGDFGSIFNAYDDEAWLRNLIGGGENFT